MYRKQLLSILLFLSLNSFAQNEFITTWKPNSSGIIDNSISFGGTGTAYTISWEEVGYSQHNGIISSVTSNSSTPLNISFGTPLNPNPNQASYKLKVSNGSGLFYGFRASVNTIDPNANTELFEINQWGNTLWLQQFNSGFAGCPNLNVTASDVPNLSQITNTSQMFFNCSSLVGNNSFSNWNTSNITNMSGMFSRASLFNQNIGAWNVANVTDFNGMFSFASTFNQNISNWNTAAGTNFSAMFKDALAFNQPLNTWNVSNATNFRYFFSNAISFNQPLNNWNTGKVTDFEHMFENAGAFNQPIGNWDVSKVTYFAGFNMFNGASLFDQDISTWNIKFQNFTWNSVAFGLNNSGLSCTNYDNFLIALNNNPTWTLSSITSGSISATGLFYSSPQAIMARAQLINKGFTITGDNYGAGCSILSISESSNKMKTLSYPNPTTGIIIVEATENEEVNTYDGSGKNISRVSLKKGKNTIDLTGHPSGTYFLKGNKTFIKIIKQ